MCSKGSPGKKYQCGYSPKATDAYQYKIMFGLWFHEIQEDAIP